nr:MAG TPA: hypothetical protein [Caudoviricetes sp.]
MQGINSYYNKRTGSNSFLIDSKDSLIDTSSYSTAYACYSDRCHLPFILIVSPFQFVMNWNEFEFSLLFSLPSLLKSS